MIERKQNNIVVNINGTWNSPVCPFEKIAHLNFDRFSIAGNEVFTFGTKVSGILGRRTSIRSITRAKK